MSEYRWSAERVEVCWPDENEDYTVRVLTGQSRWSLWLRTESEAQSLIDWINRTDLPECPEWATLMPVASGAALKANDPDGEWERSAFGCDWRIDHNGANGRNLYPIRRTPAPAEPLTERVPLAECLLREVLVDGERRVIEELEGRPEGWRFWCCFAWLPLAVAPDGTVEVLRRSTEDGER